MSGRRQAKAAEEWDRLLQFVASQGASLESSSRVEDFIDRHADAFAERIEDEVERNRVFAELVATAHIGDMSGPGVERIARLQEELIERGDLGITRWRGWVPFPQKERS